MAFRRVTVANSKCLRRQGGCPGTGTASLTDTVRGMMKRRVSFGCWCGLNPRVSRRMSIAFGITSTKMEQANYGISTSNSR